MQWFNLTQVCWNGPESMTSKFAIVRWYPQADMKSFFHEKLGVENAPADILVSELQDLANAYAEQELSSSTHVHVTNMLDELSTMITAGSCPSNIDSLCEAAIFPVHSPDPADSLKLRSLDKLYLPDKSGKYAKAFEGKVCLLQLSSIEVNRIHPLLSLASFKSHVRTLETAVNRASVIGGQQILDAEATACYTERVKYFER